MKGSSIIHYTGIVRLGWKALHTIPYAHNKHKLWTTLILVYFPLRTFARGSLTLPRWVLASESWREAWRPSPQRWIHEPSVVRDRNGNPQEDPLAVHCFCICSGSALLGDLLWVSRYRERDLLSVLLIYPGIFLRVFIAYRLLVWFLYVWLYSAICSCVLVVLVKLLVVADWLTIERPLSWHLHEVRSSPQSSGGRASLCVFFFHLVCLYCYMSPPRPYTIYISYAYGMIYSLYVLKVPLNTKQTNKHPSPGIDAPARIRAGNFDNE